MIALWCSLGALILVSTLLFAAAARCQPTLIVAPGDSNTAGFGVGREYAFPARLQALLRSGGYDVQVANVGITGDTLGGMLARLDHSVPPGTGIVIVQGGYNDLLARRTAPELLASIQASSLALPNGISKACSADTTIPAGMPLAAALPADMALCSWMAAHATRASTGVWTGCT
jgi:acyl-CoA thioesterase-1